MPKIQVTISWNLPGDMVGIFESDNKYEIIYEFRSSEQYVNFIDTHLANEEKLPIRYSKVYMVDEEKLSLLCLLF